MVDGGNFNVVENLCLLVIGFWFIFCVLLLGWGCSVMVVELIV